MSSMVVPYITPSSPHMMHECNVEWTSQKEGLLPGFLSCLILIAILFHEMYLRTKQLVYNYQTTDSKSMLHYEMPNLYLEQSFDRKV
jgi:hypothetical protein